MIYYNKWQKKEKSLLSKFRHVHNLAGFNIRAGSKPSTKPWSLVQQNKLCKTITETDAVYLWCLRAENKIEVHLDERKQRYLKYWSTIFSSVYHESEIYTWNHCHFCFKILWQLSKWIKFENSYRYTSIKKYTFWVKIHVPYDMSDYILR